MSTVTDEAVAAHAAKQRVSLDIARKQLEYAARPILAIWRDSQASDVLFAGGELYRNTMWKASGANLCNIMKITETDGAGIGVQREQLSAWMTAQFAPQLEIAA